MSNPQLTKKNTIRRFLPLSAIVTVVVVAFLFYAFVSGLTFQFYASFLFLFYALTNRIWVSVVMLGIFQTLILVPFRVVRLISSNNIKEFQQEIGSIKDSRKRQESFQSNLRSGNKTFLFYLVDFTVQLVSFISLGRLFLTDFYSVKIDPAKLYSFVPYPEYPIQDTFFKLPYPIITKTKDLGWNTVLIVWLVLVVAQVVVLGVRSLHRRNVAKGKSKVSLPSKLTRYASGYFLLTAIISYFLIRHFPVGLRLGIFSGDVSIPNRTLNSVTAWATFGTILWFGINKNLRKAKQAEEQGVSEKIIEKTQKEMLGDSIKNAVILGLGAYFITNRIPSAFELSIFTLEIIALFSPLTMDRIILAATKKKINKD